MGKFLDKFKSGASYVDNKANSIAQKQRERPKEFHGGKIREQQESVQANDMLPEDNFNDDFNDDFNEDFNDKYDDPYDANIQQAQKPESFHHFILDNKFKHLERSIRGYKDVYNKHTQKWEVKRKEIHCFTDEEAESIVRAAEAHLSPDIKLARMTPEAFGQMMDLIYDEFRSYFYRVAEYRYGRYNTIKNGKTIKVNYDLQGKMKDENKKILVELYNSIWANYSRAVGGKENLLTHDSVRGQESLQQSGSDDFSNTRLR